MIGFAYKTVSVMRQIVTISNHNNLPGGSKRTTVRIRRTTSGMICRKPS